MYGNQKESLLDELWFLEHEFEGIIYGDSSKYIRDNRANKDKLMFKHRNILCNMLARNRKDICDKWADMQLEGRVGDFNRIRLNFNIKHIKPERTFKHCTKGICGPYRIKESDDEILYDIESCRLEHTWQEEYDIEGEKKLLHHQSWYYVVDLNIRDLDGKEENVASWDSRYKIDGAEFQTAWSYLDGDEVLSGSSFSGHPDDMPRTEDGEIDWHNTPGARVKTPVSTLADYEELGEHLHNSQIAYQALPMNISVVEEIKKAEQTEKTRVIQDHWFFNSMWLAFNIAMMIPFLTNNPAIELSKYWVPLFMIVNTVFYFYNRDVFKRKWNFCK